MTGQFYNKKKYPFVLKFSSTYEITPLLGPKFASFMIAVLSAMAWLVDGTFKSAGIAAAVACIFLTLVLAPHALAKSRSIPVKSLATILVGCISLAGFVAGILLFYVLVFVRPGTGDFRYYLNVMMVLTALNFFWLSYAYAFQIYYYWKDEKR